MTFDDKGLGVTSLWFISPLPNDPTTNGISSYSRSCTGSVGSGSCASPTSWSTDQVSYKLPEGESTIAVIPYDAVGRGAYETWVQRVDRSAPVVGSPTGELVEQATNIVQTKPYALNVSASDGSEATSSSKRSGVAGIKLYIDNNSEPAATATRPCSGNGGSCPATMADTLLLDPINLSPGQHTFSVTAIDALGHESPKAARQFSFVVRSDEVEPQVTSDLHPTATPNEFELTLQGNDGAGAPAATSSNPYGSGIVEIDVLVDGTEVANFDQDCPYGGCGFSDSVVLTAQSPGQTPDAAIIAYDAAGNVSVTHAGTRRRAYSHFGYNDFFTTQLNTCTGSQTSANRCYVPTRGFATYARQMVSDAYDGGANTLRVTFSWCTIARYGDPRPGYPLPSTDPDDWDWGSASRLDTPEGFFGLIRTINANRPAAAAPLEILPVFTDSPAWARPSRIRIDGSDPDPGYCQGENLAEDPGQAPTPPDSAHLPNWTDFVEAFLLRYGPSANQQFGTSGPLNGVVAVEPWNEPNLEKFWGVYSGKEQWAGTAPGFYADLVVATQAGVLASGNPSVKTVGGSLSPAGESLSGNANLLSFTSAYLQRLSNLGQAQAIDAIGLHLYASGAPTDRKARERVMTDFRDVVELYDDQVAFDGLGRWITEIGFPAKRGSSVNLKEQRLRLLDVLERFQRSDRKVKAFIVHRFYDDAPPIGNGSEDEDKMFGVWPTYLTGPKTLYCRLWEEVRTPGASGGLCAE